MIFGNQLQERPPGLTYTAHHSDTAAPPLLTAADILEFLQQSMDVEALAWLMPATRFTRYIPAFSGNILELHFGKRENSIDFATRLNTIFDRGLIQGVRQQTYRLPFVANSLTKLIKQHEVAFNYGVENIWVEYDAPFKSAPALFFDINREVSFYPKAAYDCLQQITDAFECQVNSKLLQFLEQTGQAGLQVVYYGLMFSRKSKSIRLTINGINPEHLASTLEKLGWQGNYQVLEKLTLLYLNKEQKLVIGVDFGDCLESRIGIEVFDDNQAAFIQTLYNNGHINHPHFKLLNAWKQSLLLSGELSIALTDLHQRLISKLYTRINHFKFVIDNTQTVAVKGYLYYCF